MSHHVQRSLWLLLPFFLFAFLLLPTQSVLAVACTGQDASGAYLPPGCTSGAVTGGPCTGTNSSTGQPTPPGCTPPASTSPASTTPSGGSPNTLINPLGSGVTIESFIGRLVKAILGLSGSVALLMFVWGGFQYLWSAGDPKKVDKGKETLKNAVLGIVIIFFAFTLVNALIKVLASGALT